MRFSIMMLIFTQLLMPALFLLNLSQSEFGSRLELFLSTLVVAAYMVFVFLVGRWDWFGYMLRVFLIVSFLIVLFLIWKDSLAKPFWNAQDLSGIVPNLVRLGLFLIFTVLIGKVLRGFLKPANAVDVSFPLCHGTYYIAHGGNDTLINYHQAHTAQRFALDLVKLNPLGIRALGIYPKRLARYFIFDDPVYSPVEGTVLQAQDGLPDLTPPERDTVQRAGNHVVIQPTGTDCYILLAHLKQGTVQVQQGDYVRQGQLLGRVGNSGNTTEPHLHIHCATIDGDDYTGGGTGVPLLFGGRFLVRNSLVRSKPDQV